MPRFGLFAICIGQLTYKMSGIASFLPGLGDICANGTRSAPDLIREGIDLLTREGLGHFVDLLLQLKSLCINIDGVAKSPPYGVTALFQDLDLPDVGLRPRKTTRPCTSKFLLSHPMSICEGIKH